MPAERGPLVSVVMTCSGQLEYSRLSVPRVLRFSRRPLELLFIFQSGGVIDPNSPRGYFEVDGWGEQARQAGYLLACCEEVFVHHFGSRRPARQPETRAAG